jgi:hypothetical protein
MLDRTWRRELCFVTNLDTSKSHEAKGIIDELDKMLTCVQARRFAPVAANAARTYATAKPG